MQRCYGSPEVLRSADVDPPAVGLDDVLVRVHAASVHPGDCFLMTGEPYVVRLAFGLRRPRHPIPGGDLAGGVAAVAKDVGIGHNGQPHRIHPGCSRPCSGPGLTTERRS